MSTITAPINMAPRQPEFSICSEVDDLITEDCRLPVDIKAKEFQRSLETRDIKEVLLTGATGTLGPYILRELLKMPQINKVICLIRPSKEGRNSVEDSKYRLVKILEETQILEEIDMTKVTVICGDIAEKFFGLADSTWLELVDNIDAVIHCAAKISYLQKYTKVPHPKEDVRSINLAATKNTLEFACSGLKLKHVFYSSSLVGCATADMNEMRLSEDWPELEDFKGKSTLAYPISKFVGEMLMKEAVKERGIPGKVFRFPLVGGDANDGRKQRDGNIVFALYLFALKHGIFLDEPCFTPLIPVDQCAEAAVKLFFNHDAPNGVYNIGNEPITEMEFDRLASKFDYKLKKFGSSWATLKAISLVSDDSKVSKTISSIIFSLSPKAGNGNNGLSGHSLPQYIMFPAIRFYLSKKTPNFFEGRKLKMFQPEVYEKLDTAFECLERDVAYAKSQNWI